jgi:hypothetical protein
MTDLHPGQSPATGHKSAKIFGDLISYHNDGKRRTVMGQKVERA